MYTILHAYNKNAMLKHIKRDDRTKEKNKHIYTYKKGRGSF